MDRPPFEEQGQSFDACMRMGRGPLCFARSHEVQRKIDRGEMPYSALSIDGIRWIHFEFCRHLPESLLEIVDPNCRGERRRAAMSCVGQSERVDLAQVAMEEQRAAQRRRLLKAGTISFGGGVIDCTVRNLSETGAALDVISPVGIPDRFTLVVDADRSELPCRIVWRKEKRIGVRFEPS